MNRERGSVASLCLVCMIVLSILLVPAGQTVPALAAATACDSASALWVGSSGFGLNCLDNTGWHSYTKDSGGLSDPNITAISICADKSIWLSTGSDVNSTTDGTAWKQLTADWVSPDGVACDGKGGVWVAHYQGVSHNDGTKWTDFDAKLLGSGDNVSLVKDVAVAADGTVWVVTSNSIAALTGDKWTVYEKDKGFDKEYFFEKIALDAKGNVWASQDSGVFMFDGKTWTAEDSADLISVQALTVDSQGHVWAGTAFNGLFMFDGKGWVSYNRSNSKITSNNVRSLAADSQGRIWVGTEYGLDVFDGKDWTAYLMNDSDLLDNSVFALAVNGSGPKLTAPGAQKTGSLKGHVKTGATAAPGAVVELCSETIGFTYTGASPCADNPFTVQSTADSDGAFAFKDVPVGRYGMTIQNPSDKKWTRLTDSFGGDFKAEITAGNNADTGDIDISKTS
jgi:ligand-binding sensor domain-containing protein